MSSASEFLSLSPVVFVERIEPCLPFWTETLGFQTVVSMPEGDEKEGRLGFAMLSNGGVAVMLQSFGSQKEDMPGLSCAAMDAFLFIKVKGIEALAAKLDPVSVVVPRRKTFYGADEIAVRPHPGCIVCLAEFPDEA